MSLWKLSKSSRVRDPFSTEINKFGLRMLPPARKGTLLVSIRWISPIDLRPDHSYLADLQESVNVLISVEN